jgi:hypothetical protein
MAEDVQACEKKASLDGKTMHIFRRASEGMEPKFSPMVSLLQALW